MYGLGILKGMAITMKHFVDSYLDDIFGPHAVAVITMMRR